MVTNRISAGRRSVLIVLALALAGSPAAVSAEDLSGVRAAAEAGDLAAQRTLGEALLYGTDGAEQDADAGLAYLTRAAEAGDTEAKSKLGQTLLWGISVAPDLDRAEALLAEAAAASDVEAQTVLGEQLVGGWILRQDTARGRALLEQAIEAGSTRAQIALGTFLLGGDALGRDREAALDLFEAAADAGDGRGLARYGEDLMWRLADKTAAEDYLTRAGEMGVSSAWTTLAEGAMYGYLGQRRRFDEFAEKALAQGESRIAVLEANRRLYGISQRASGPKAVAGLEEAADAGNAEAAEFLIRLVRDGNGLNVRSDPDQARTYLDLYGDLLAPETAMRLEIGIAAAGSRTDGAYASLSGRLASAFPSIDAAFGEDLYAANPNFAVYLLQEKFREADLYAGSLNGLANRSTLRAMHRECMQLEGDYRCRDALLVPNVVAQLLVR